MKGYLDGNQNRNNLLNKNITNNSPVDYTAFQGRPVGFLFLPSLTIPRSQKKRNNKRYVKL